MESRDSSDVCDASDGKTMGAFMIDAIWMKGEHMFCGAISKACYAGRAGI